MVERTHTLVFRQRYKRGEKVRESQAEDLAEKTEERATGSLSFVQLGRTLTQEGAEI